MKAIRVAVADDSSFVRQALVRILAADPRIEVVGTAATGEELIDNLALWQADVITLDLVMPGMGGLRALDLIRERRPTPVIVLSTHARVNAPLAIEALHRGAVDFIDKQRYSLLDFHALGQVLTEKILQVSGSEMPEPVPVPAAQPAIVESPPPPTPPESSRHYDLVVLGASTGGPLAVQQVLADLGAAAGAPILIVQHMPEGFTAPFAERLDTQLALPVREATDREPLIAGTAYVGPAGRHFRVARRNDGLESRLSEQPDTSAHRPSVDELFASAAQTVGARVLGVLLTGMGRDGAQGMLALAEVGAHTLIQDEESSVVFGMPRAALELGAAKETLPLGKIGARVRQLLG